MELMEQRDGKTSSLKYDVSKKKREHAGLPSFSHETSEIDELIVFSHEFMTSEIRT